MVIGGGVGGRARSHPHGTDSHPIWLCLFSSLIEEQLSSQYSPQGAETWFFSPIHSNKTKLAHKPRSSVGQLAHYLTPVATVISAPSGGKFRASMGECLTQFPQSLRNLCPLWFASFYPRSDLLSDEGH